ncbi:MAG: DUF3347 domain-containing protein [Arachidicoccus sp.]|nr:DUF3347 domain-containing protein [Arachidicoccus sp.]
MKKGIFIIVAVIACFAIYFFVANKKGEKGGMEKEKPLNISKTSEFFNASLQNALSEYYQMHDAFVHWDSANIIDSLADSLEYYVRAIAFDKLNADSLLVNTAKNYASAIEAECVSVQKETDIKEQRKSFYTISENMFDLLRTVQYDKEKIFHIRCPMAFGKDQEGYWLSNKKEIINPYFGDKDPANGDAMLHCGNIEDSIYAN